MNVSENPTTAISYGNYRPPRVIRTVAKLDEPFVYACVFPHPSISCTNGTGINFEIFEIVMSTLNLNYTVAMADEGETGFIRDGKWHGMIGQLLRKEVDMTATLVSVTEERINAVDFSSPASFYIKGFLVQHPSATDAAAVPTFLATPFSPTVWACFTASLVVYVFLAFFARLLLHTPGDMRPFRFFRDSVLDVVRSPLGQPEPRPYSAALRFTLNYLNVPMFFLMNYYTAALTGTLMFMAEPPDPFSGYDELARLIRDKKFTMVSTGSIAKFLPPHPNETVAEDDPDTIIRRAFSYNPPVMVSTMEQVARAVERNKSLVFWGSYNQVLDAAAHSCSLHVIEDRSTRPTWLAFAFRKGDPLQAIVSKTLYTDTSVESFMKRMYVKYTKHRHCSDDSDEQNEGGSFFALGLRHMQGAYFVLLYGLAIAAPAFLGENLAKKLAKKHQHRRATIAAKRRISVLPGMSDSSAKTPPHQFHSVRMHSVVIDVTEHKHDRPDSGTLYGRSKSRLGHGHGAGPSVRRASTISFHVSTTNPSPKISPAVSPDRSPL